MIHYRVGRGGWCGCDVTYPRDDEIHGRAMNSANLSEYSPLVTHRHNWSSFSGSMLNLISEKIRCDARVSMCQ